MGGYKVDYKRFLFKNISEINEFEKMIRMRIYHGKKVYIVGNFGLSNNKWKVKTETGKIMIVNDSELTKVYNDNDFLNKFKYRF